MTHNILIIYHYNHYPMRQAWHDHLYSFRTHSKNRYFYVNMACATNNLSQLKYIPFDLIIFHDLFLARRWHPHEFKHMLSGMHWLKQSSATKLALIQDEHFNIDIVNDFIQEFAIKHICSLANPSFWPVFYPHSDKQNTLVQQVLTGYIDDKTVRKIKNLSRNINRDLDVGYRATYSAPWLGKHGRLKGLLGKIFEQALAATSLNFDISTHPSKTIKGWDWYHFLLRCKYTIGVEGGASLWDQDGHTKEKTEHFIRNNPKASFEEVETHCFPNRDGEIQYRALSPRHLEACVTKTCQILIEGDYNGVLKPWEHYIPLKPDFSNLDEVIALVKNDSLRKDIIERTYQDIVLSNKYSYQTFVEHIESVIPLTKHTLAPQNKWQHLKTTIQYLQTLLWDRVTWWFVARQYKRKHPFVVK